MAAPLRPGPGPSRRPPRRTAAPASPPTSSSSTVGTRALFCSHRSMLLRCSVALVVLLQAFNVASGSLVGASFGTAIKGCYVAPGTSHCKSQLWETRKEIDVFSHECTEGPVIPASDTPDPEVCSLSLSALCVLSHFWAGGSWEGYETSRLRCPLSPVLTLTLTLSLSPSLALTRQVLRGRRGDGQCGHAVQPGHARLG